MRSYLAALWLTRCSCVACPLCTDHCAAMSSKLAPPSSSSTAPKKKLTRKQQEEEDERLAREAAEAAAASLAAIPPSPFDRIDEIWALDGRVAAQRELVGQIVRASLQCSTHPHFSTVADIS